MTSDGKVPAPGSDRFNLSLLEGFVDLLRFQLAQLASQLTDLQIGPTDRLIRHQMLRRSERRLHGTKMPDDIAKDLEQVERITDIRALAEKIDQAAESVLIESKRMWGSLESVSGNVHKIAFGTPPAPSEPDAGEAPTARATKARKLVELAAQLAQQVKNLQAALAALQSAQRRN